MKRKEKLKNCKKEKLHFADDCHTEFGQPEHQLHVLIPYIESSSFSFCCFHHSFYDFVDDDDNLAVNGMLVLWELPAWLMRALSLFLTSFDLAFI